MTPAHVFFIPAIFFLGFFVGGVASRAIEHVKSNSQYRIDSADTPGALSGVALGVALMVFISTFIATHMFPSLGGAKALGAALGGQSIFDQQASFTSAEVYARLDAFGPAGRAMYQDFTYSIDVLFPLTLLVFLFLLAKFVGERSSSRVFVRKALTAVPMLWFFTDMLENSIVYTLISQYPRENAFLGDALGAVTTIKFILLLSSLAIPAISSVVLRDRKTAA